MTLIEKGRICTITKGSDTGKQAVIKEVVDRNFVIIAGEKTKERRINIKHLEPTGKKTEKIPSPEPKPVKEKKPVKTTKTKEEKAKK